MITVYSKEACNQCAMAVKLLQMRKVEHRVLKLDEDYTVDELNKMHSIYGYPEPRQFPVVFNGQILVGGFDDLKKSIINGQIK